MSRPALLLCGLCAACCPRPWPKALTPLTEPIRVLQAASDGQAPLRSLSATAKVDAFSREGRIKAREVLVVDRAGRLRFETLSPFEQPLSTLVSDGKTFSLYDLGKKIYYHGEATPQNVSRLLPIRMRGEDIARLLMGDPPRIAHDGLSVEALRCKTRYRLALTQRAGPFRQELEVDAERLFAVASRVYQDGALLYEATFDEHRNLAGAPLPRRIRYRAPSDEVDVLLFYTDDVAANEKHEDGIFRLEPPRGAAVRRLD